MRIAGIRVALLLLLLTAGAARAEDDFIAQCRLGEEHDAEKICGCISEKIAAADRPQALAAMRRANELMAAGKEVDPTSLTPEMREGLRKLVEAETQCLR